MTQIIPFVVPALIASYRGAECFLKTWMTGHCAAKPAPRTRLPR